MPDTVEPALTPLEQYAIGYRKPPVADQWKKGQSGNPAGKKKGVKNTKTMFLAACRMPVTIKGGKTMTMLQAFIHTVAQHAALGNMKVMSAYFWLMEKFPLEPPEKQDLYVSKDANGVFVMHPLKLSDQAFRDIEDLRTRVPALLAMNSGDADECEDAIFEQTIDSEH